MHTDSLMQYAPSRARNTVEGDGQCRRSDREKSLKAAESDEESCKESRSFNDC